MTSTDVRSHTPCLSHSRHALRATLVRQVGEATDVKVSDSEWDAQLFETKGDISASFDSIAAGATKAYSFSVVPSVPLNRFEQPEISVSYTTEGRTVSAQGPKVRIELDRRAHALRTPWLALTRATRYALRSFQEYLKVHSKDEMFRMKMLSVCIELDRRALAHRALARSHSRYAFARSPGGCVVDAGSRSGRGDVD